MSTITKTAKTAKADYEILVTLKNGYPVPRVPDNMKVGETVHYKSNDGAVTIKFHAHQSPFLNRNGNEKLKITGKEPPIKLSKKGKFSFNCLITPPGGVKPLTWPKNSSYPGGNMDVG
jgi:hypothetical protein